MRADIHDGPEHMLQSETEYIDARPYQPASPKASCTARPDHTLGQQRRSKPAQALVRSTPKCRHADRQRKLRLAAMKGHSRYHPKQRLASSGFGGKPGFAAWSRTQHSPDTLHLAGQMQQLGL